MTHCPQPSLTLHPEIKVDIFRHGHCESAEDDFSRKLSLNGKTQARALSGELLAHYDIGICSSAPRTLETAVFTECAAASYWFVGEKRQFYSPASDVDHAELLRMGADIKLSSYRAYLHHDSSGIFQRFKGEVLATLSGWVDVDKQQFLTRARRILIFNHAVMSNAIAEALFPQHTETLRDIELAPCDGIRLSATKCEHLRLTLE